ncbi:(2Fe-2S)-binding protein [Streptomyces cirratus]
MRGALGARAGPGPGPRLVAVARGGLAGTVAAAPRPGSPARRGPRGDPARPPRRPGRGAARAVRGIAPGTAREQRLGPGRRVARADRPGTGGAGGTPGRLPARRRRPPRRTGTFIHEDGLGVAFTRRSCCLYYRVPGGGLCGDCVLRTR